MIINKGIRTMPDIERLTITLPADMAAAVKSAVATGDYASVSEVIREALRDWKMKRALRLQEFASLKAGIDKGLADIDAGRLRDIDAASIVARGTKLLAGRSSLATKAIRSPAKSALDAETERTARTFMRRIERRYPVRRGILFGSRARRTHSADSDADIAVVLKGRPRNRTAAGLDMAGIAFDVLLETGILVEPLPLWDIEFSHPEKFANPALIDNILREGVVL
jgi:putative addiction module CopG family antidote